MAKRTATDPAPYGEDCPRCDWLEVRLYLREKVDEIDARTRAIDEKLDESLEQMRALIKELAGDIGRNRQDIGKLQVRTGIVSAIYGALAGALTVVGVVLWGLFSPKK